MNQLLHKQKSKQILVRPCQSSVCDALALAWVFCSANIFRFLFLFRLSSSSFELVWELEVCFPVDSSEFHAERHGVDVLGEVGCIGLGGGLGFRDGVLDLLPALLLDGFDLGRRRQLHGGDEFANPFDGVALLPDAGNLVAGAVRAARVAHRVPVVPVRVHLHHQGAVLKHVRLRESNRLLHCEDVHSVDFDSRDVVSSLVEGGLLGATPLGRAHSVVVVLADVHRGKIPQGRNVQRLEDLALVRRAVAVKGKRAVGLARVLLLESDSHPDGHLRSDDAISSVELVGPAIHVHRPAHPLGGTARAAQKLRHHLVNGSSPSEVGAVVSVSGDDGVASGERCFHADAHGLLPVVQMAEPTDELPLVQDVRGDFHAPHAVKVAEEGENLRLAR
mmetsp:Transcript_11739/g.29944  ORF Transcript_11739/g.29944 Transcript_11739/m.29944 type:complete len:390 (+) Transcript_11739:777-1946(+)